MSLAQLDPATRQLIYLHNMVQRDADRRHQETMAMCFAMVETERARSDNNVRMMERMYSHVDGARREHTEWVRSFADRKPDPLLQQMSTQLGLLSQRVEELDDFEDETPEELVARLQQQDPGQMQQVMGLMMGVLNSPLGQTFANIAAQKFGGAAVPDAAE